MAPEAEALKASVDLWQAVGGPVPATIIGTLTTVIGVLFAAWRMAEKGRLDDNKSFLKDTLPLVMTAINNAANCMDGNVEQLRATGVTDQARAVAFANLESAVKACTEAVNRLERK